MGILMVMAFRIQWIQMLIMMASQILWMQMLTVMVSQILWMQMLTVMAFRTRWMERLSGDSQECREWGRQGILPQGILLQVTHQLRGQLLKLLLSQHNSNLISLLRLLQVMEALRLYLAPLGN
jgi:hypothetical protein